MRLSYLLVGALALVLALGAGCKKDGEAAAGGEKAGEKAGASEKAGEGAEKAAEGAEKAAEGAEKAAEKAAEGAEKAAEAQPQPAPGDSPAAAVPDKLPTPAPAAAAAAQDLPIEEAKLDKLVQYSEEMAKILEENAEDPAEAAKKLQAYLETNKEEREALLNEFEGMKEKLTPEQQQALGMKLLAKLGPLMQRMQKLFQEHPNLATDPKIQEAMTPFKK